MARLVRTSLSTLLISTGLVLFASCGYSGDRGNECRSGTTRDCGTDLGSCEVGRQTCVDGWWGPCRGGTIPEVEFCDRKDNDCDGDIDEGYGVGESCLLSDGRVGRRECFDELTAACRDGVGGAGGSSGNGGSSGAAGRKGGNGGSSRGGNGGGESGAAGEGAGQAGDDSGPECTPERCDGVDNDCDGDVDDGFSVGAECDAGLGCIGVRACHAAGTHASCVPDRERATQERCDGIDNDCDGIADYSIGPSELIPACDCAPKPLVVGVDDDESIRDAAGLCQTTGCTPLANEFRMAFCLDCAATPQPYAMCQGLPIADLSDFDRGDAVLRVSFTLDATALLPIDLYYQADVSPRGTVVTARKYVRLADVGLEAGSYTKEFIVDHACTPGYFPADCHGTRSGPACPSCQPEDTCGPPQGRDCSGLDFSKSMLQAAVEFCPDEGRFEGTLTLHEVSVRDVGCVGLPP